MTVAEDEHLIEELLDTGITAATVLRVLYRRGLVSQGRDGSYRVFVHRSSSNPFRVDL